MAFCSNCGAKLPDGGKFCPNCGAASAAPVHPTPVAPVAPVKVKGKINWTVFIIMMLIGLLILGAGAAVVIDLLDDGEFNLFGLLDSDRDEDEDDDKDKDDDKAEDKDEDKDEDDDKDKPAATEAPAEIPEPTESPEPTENEDIWCEWHYNGLNFSLPGSFHEKSPGLYFDKNSDTEIMIVFSDLETWQNRMGDSDIYEDEDFMRAFREYNGGTLHIENGYFVVASNRDEGYVYFTCYVLDDQVCFIQTTTPMSWRQLEYDYEVIMQTVYFD